MIAKGAQHNATASLLRSDWLRTAFGCYPTREQAGGKTWSATEWAETREVGSSSRRARPSARRCARCTAFGLTCLVMRLLDRAAEEPEPVWFVLDELASLQRLPQLHTAITENRKSRNPLVLGFQGKAQLEVIYGHLPRSCYRNLPPKYFLRRRNPRPQSGSAMRLARSKSSA